MKFIIYQTINTFLNPLFILAYLILFSENRFFFINLNSNTSRIFAIPYFASTLIFGLVILAAQYWLYKANDTTLSFFNFALPHYWFLSLFSGLVSFLVLYYYLSDSGMEGNIMGFLFFPLLLIGSAFSLFIYLKWNLQYFAFPSYIQQISNQPLNIGFWTVILLHCFNPLLVNIYKFGDSNSIPTKGIESFITISLASLVVFTVVGIFYWIGFKVLSRPFHWSEYFGQGQSIIYFIPYIYGSLWATYLSFASKREWQTGFLKKIDSFLYALSVLMIILWFINSIRYLLGKKV